MSNWKNDIDLIDKQFKGQLNSTEQKALDDKIYSDPEFASLSKDMQLAQEAIRRKALRSNFETLQEIEKSLPPLVMEESNDTTDEPKINHKSGIRRQMAKWSAAASVLLLIIAGSLFFFNGGNNPDEIYQDYFQVYPNMETERGLLNIGDPRTRAENNPERNAYNFYDAKNYDAAIMAFQVLIKLDSKPKDYFFLGNAYLANNQFTQAIDTFRKLKDAPSEYKTRANWYLALAYLKSGKQDMAKATLQEIISNPNARSYQEKATQILKELK